MAIKCDVCGLQLYSVQGLAACGCYPNGINVTAPKPATPEPPEWKGPVWIDDGPHDVTPDWWAKVGEARLASLDLDRALEDFTARRKAKREVNPAPTAEEILEWHARQRVEWAARKDLARAMSAPLPHDPDIHTRLMPWRGKE